MWNPRFVAVTALAVLLGAAWTQGQDEEDHGPRLPINPFADASVGDWAVLCVKRGRESQTIEWKVEKVEGDKVTVSTRDTADNEEKPTLRAFSKKEAPTFGAYTGVGEAAELAPEEKMKIADEEREVGGKKFKCKKLTLPARECNFVLWISSEAKLGYIALNVLEGKATTSETVIVGYGTAAKTEWGLTAAQFAAAPKLTECGKVWGLDIYAAEGWEPTVVGEGVTWSKEGYMGLRLSSTKKWMDLNGTDRKGIESEDDLKEFLGPERLEKLKLESKTKTEKGWYVIAKSEGTIDKERAELIYVMKLGGEPFIFRGDLTVREEFKTLKIEEALKIAETVKVHGK